MKKNFFKFMTLGLILPLVFAGCQKDDNSNNSNNPTNPSTPVSDPEGTITVSMRNKTSYNGNNVTLVVPDGCNAYFYIDEADNFRGGSTIHHPSEWHLATIGQMSGLGNITRIPTSGWAYHAAVMPGYGYVARCVNLNRIDTTYVRIYVMEYLTAANSNGIIGARIKYQSPFVP